MNLKSVEKIKQRAENKKKDKKAKKLAQKKQDDQNFFQDLKTFIQQGPDLIYEFNPYISSKNSKTSDFSTSKKKHKDQTMINAFQSLIQIEPDIF